MRRVVLGRYCRRVAHEPGIAEKVFRSPQRASETVITELRMESGPGGWMGGQRHPGPPHRTTTWDQDDGDLQLAARRKWRARTNEMPRRKPRCTVADIARGGYCCSSGGVPVVGLMRQRVPGEQMGGPAR